MFSGECPEPVRKTNENSNSDSARRLRNGQRLRADRGTFARRAGGFDPGHNRGSPGPARTSAIAQGNGSGVAAAGERTTDRRGHGEKQLQSAGPSTKLR